METYLGRKERLFINSLTFDYFPPLLKHTHTNTNIELQKTTWSNYKYHNTVKLIVCVVPNSTITLISKSYSRKTIEKKLL